ncbi:MAG: glycoside hydrolase family 28 protein [Bryobacteraceae bacterium]
MSCLVPAIAVGASFDVRDLGAKGDGTAKDTQSIQTAIDRASAAGGTVVFPPGSYLSGTLHLRSGVTLWIEKGAKLVFSPDDGDFDAYEALPDRPQPQTGNPRPLPANATPAEMRMRAAPPAWDDTETSYAHYALLSGDGVHNVSIEGPGEIDGNRVRRGGPKPIAFRNSEWIAIRGITVRNAPNYNISLIATDHVEVEGVRLIDGYADGIDPDNCQFVRITNCYIDAADDAICPKASMAAGRPPRGTSHLVVANCITRTSANHFKFGTESEGNLRNVSVANCVMLSRENGHRARSGISIESVDGAHVDGVVVSNLSMEDAMAPIFIRLGVRGRGMDKPVPGTLENILIRNVTAKGASIASSITGSSMARVQDVTIDGFASTGAGGSGARDLDVPELPDKYPSGDMFGDLPALGLYGRHVDGLRLQDIKIHAVKPDERPALVFDDVARLELSGFDSTNAPSHQPVVLFRDVAGALLFGNRLSSAAEIFLSVLGGRSQGIALRGNDLRLARQEIRKASDAPANAVSTDSVR